MSRITRVLWTITPLEAPQPWRSCSRCGAARPFRCSGKFRLNANGKRLDAWLVYKCVDCDTTWNRTIFERRADMSPAMLTALQENNAALVAQFAFDIAGLRREAHHVETFGDVAVHKTVLSEEVASVSSVEITLAVSVATAVRLDRLLSSELGLSRSRIAAMAEAGQLTASAALGKAVRNGTIIRIAGIETIGSGAGGISPVAGEIGG